MGKKLSTCCRRQNDSPYKTNKDSQYNLTAHIKYDETVSSLQHISEREPAESDADPSTNPTTGPLFLLKSDGINKRNSHSRTDLYEFRILKKSSSCSTIFLDNCTVSHPHLKDMIKCVAIAIYYHIYNRSSEGAIEIFDERVHNLDKSMPTRRIEMEPDFREIYNFIRILFNSAQLSSECAIVTLVYLERLLAYAEIDIVPFTWRRILLGSILLASKVWDDQAVWNVDYCQILRDMSVEDMNELERRFLELIQFNINVPLSIYVKYYFELRKLADKNDITSAAEPLNETRALQLEATSRAAENEFVNLKKKIKRSHSFENIPFGRESMAILS